MDPNGNRIDLGSSKLASVHSRRNRAFDKSYVNSILRSCANGNQHGVQQENVQQIIGIRSSGHTTGEPAVSLHNGMGASSRATSSSSVCSNRATSDEFSDLDKYKPLLDYQKYELHFQERAKQSAERALIRKTQEWNLSRSKANEAAAATSADVKAAFGVEYAPNRFPADYEAFPQPEVPPSGIDARLEKLKLDYLAGNMVFETNGNAVQKSPSPPAPVLRNTSSRSPPAVVDREALERLAQERAKCLERMKRLRQLLELSDNLKLKGRDTALSILKMCDTKFAALAALTDARKISFTQKELENCLDSVVKNLQQNGLVERSSKRESGTKAPSERSRAKPTAASTSRNPDENRFSTVYKESLKVVAQLENDAQQADKVPGFRARKMELFKAIQAPINKICHSGFDTLNREVRELIQRVAGESANQGTFCFVVNLTISRLVKQAEVNVGTFKKGAFPLAYVTLGLLAQFPDLVKYFKAKLYATCPALVPHFHQESLKLIASDDYKLCVSGCASYFAALLLIPVPDLKQVKPKFGYVQPKTSLPNPFGDIELAVNLLRNWMAREPVMDVTAIVMFEILRVLGFKIGRTHAGLIRELKQQYLPRIEVSSRQSESQGAYMRLKLLLDEGFQRPDGLDLGGMGGLSSRLGGGDTNGNATPLGQSSGLQQFRFQRQAF